MVQIAGKPDLKSKDLPVEPRADSTQPAGAMPASPEHRNDALGGMRKHAPAGHTAKDLGVTVDAATQREYAKLYSRLVKGGEVVIDTQNRMMYLDEKAVPLILQSLRNASPLEKQALAAVLGNIALRTHNPKVFGACTDALLALSNTLGDGPASRNIRLSAYFGLSHLAGNTFLFDPKKPETCDERVIDRFVKLMRTEGSSVARDSALLSTVNMTPYASSEIIKGVMRSALLPGPAQDAAREALGMMYEMKPGAREEIRALAVEMSKSSDIRDRGYGEETLRRMTLASTIKVGDTTLNPFILNGEALQIAADNFKPRPNDDRPVVVIVIAAHDHNGVTFNASRSRMISYLTEHKDAQAPHGRRVVVFQAGENPEKAADKEVLLGIKMVTGNMGIPGEPRANASTLVLNGHGTESGITFGADFNDPKARISITDKALIASIGKCLTKDAQIILDSCSGGGAGFDIADAFSAIGDVQAATQSVGPGTAVQVVGPRIKVTYKDPDDPTLVVPTYAVGKRPRT